MIQNGLKNQNGQYRDRIYIGLLADIILKDNQSLGILTRGYVGDFLTSQDYHSAGIKVRLIGGGGKSGRDLIGRVQYIIDQNSEVTYFIGVVEDYNNTYKIASYSQTLEQVNFILKKPINIKTEDNIKVEWKDIFDYDNDKLMAKVIIKDREIRDYKHQELNDLPRYAVFTIKNQEIIRIEYYQGEIEYKKLYDVRRKDLYKENLSDHILKPFEAVKQDIIYKIS